MKRGRLSNEPADRNSANSEKRLKSNPRNSLSSSSSSLPLYERPYQHDDDDETKGLNLNFNFWVNNQYLNASAHVFELLYGLVEVNNVSFLKQVKFPSQIKHMIVVNLSHLDPISFNEYVISLRSKCNKPKSASKVSRSFFAQSSSMPIHCEMKVDDRCRHVSDYAPLFATIAWREKAAIDLNALALYKGSRSKSIFTDHVLVFKVSWLYFYFQLHLQCIFFHLELKHYNKHLKVLLKIYLIQCYSS